MLFHNYGIYWDLRLVDFGRQGRGGSGSLKGYIYEPDNDVEADGVERIRKKKKPAIVNFAKQTGIYALQKQDRSIVYIGQTAREKDSLLARLREHSRSDFKGRWTHFSWFGFHQIEDKIISKPNSSAATMDEKVALNHVEGILLELIEPPLNKRGANWRGTQRYTQHDPAEFEDDAFIPLDDDAYALWKKLDALESQIKKLGEKS